MILYKILVKLYFMCGNVEENNIQVYASLKADIIDAYHWNVEKKLHLQNVC